MRMLIKIIALLSVASVHAQVSHPWQSPLERQHQAAQQMHHWRQQQSRESARIQQEFIRENPESVLGAPPIRQAYPHLRHLGAESHTDMPPSAPKAIGLRGLEALRQLSERSSQIPLSESRADSEAEEDNRPSLEEQARFAETLQADLQAEAKRRGEFFIQDLLHKFPRPSRQDLRVIWWGHDGIICSTGLNRPIYNGNAIYFQMLDGGQRFGSRRGIEWLVSEKIITIQEAITFLLNHLIDNDESNTVSLEVFSSNYRARVSELPPTGHIEYDIAVVYEILRNLKPLIQEEAWPGKSHFTETVNNAAEPQIVSIEPGVHLIDIVEAVLMTRPN